MERPSDRTLKTAVRVTTGLILAYAVLQNPRVRNGLVAMCAEFAGKCSVGFDNLAVKLRGGERVAEGLATQLRRETPMFEEFVPEELPNGVISVKEWYFRAPLSNRLFVQQTVEESGYVDKFGASHATNVFRIVGRNRLLTRLKDEIRKTPKIVDS